MSGARSEGEWDFSDFEESESFEAIPQLDADKGKNAKKNKLDIRRKLEDRLERKRLEDEIGSLDDDWFN